MNPTKIILIVSSTIILIPTVYWIVKTILFEAKAEILKGKVIEIIPIFKGAEYIIQVDFNGVVEEGKLIPNTAFETYRVGDMVDVLRSTHNDTVRYKSKDGLYVLPVVVATLFGFLLLIGIAMGG